MHSIFVLFALLLITLSSPRSALAESVHVAAIDWCPQLCMDDDKPGYVQEIAERVFKGSEYKLLIETFSWSRAIHQVKVGAWFALLSPAKAEAPSLIYTEYGIGVQRMCFFIPQDVRWRYDNTESLKGLRIGIASDASIEVLNPYIHDKEFNFQTMHYDQNFITKNIKMIEANRLDAFIFTQNTTQHQLKKMGLFKSYINAGCVSEEKIYMALTNTETQADKVAAFKEFFDARIIELYKSGEVNKILKKYQIAPWRDSTEH